MKGYLRHLKSEGIQDIYLKYYVAWVEQFAKFCEDRSMDYWDTNSLMDYKVRLSERHKSWLVMQALDAIEHYKYWRRGQLEESYEFQIDKLVACLNIENRSKRTVSCYVNWLKRFMSFLEKDKDWAVGDLECFIGYLAKDLKVAASTQNQAYSALSYYYQKVLLIDLGNASQKLKAKPKSNIPVSYSEKELQKIFKFMSGIELLMVKLMYGSGLRSGECLQLRIRDLDFKNKLIRVRNNYGVVKRDTVLPACLIRLLEEQVREAKKVYSSDRARDFPGVFLPESYEALGDEESDWEWFWLFPCSSIKAASVISDLKRDHHHAYHLKNEFKKALELSEVNSRSNLDSLRHSFAMGLLEGGYDIRTVQVLLGHQSVKMTMRYLKARQVRSLSVLSPLDQMEDD